MLRRVVSKKRSVHGAIRFLYPPDGLGRTTDRRRDGDRVTRQLTDVRTNLSVPCSRGEVYGHVVSLPTMFMTALHGESAITCPLVWSIDVSQGLKGEQDVSH